VVSTTIFREVIVIDFWVGHFGYGKLTAQMPSFLEKKLTRNQQRDTEVYCALNMSGW
jgi:G:T-mismatch repair DNA endonuclease (very short patch repair protein)